LPCATKQTLILGAEIEQLSAPDLGGKLPSRLDRQGLVGDNRARELRIMAKGFTRPKRRGGSGGAPIRLIAAGVVVVALVGAFFWFASQADSKRPPQQEIRVEATNVGPK
jgi:hypothetical protein